MTDMQNHAADPWVPVAQQMPVRCLLLQLQDAAGNLEIGWCQDSLFYFVSCRTSPGAAIVAWRYTGYERS